MTARRSSSSWRSYGWSCSATLDPKMSPMHHCAPSMHIYVMYLNLNLYLFIYRSIDLYIYTSIHLYYISISISISIYMCVCDFRSDPTPTSLCCLVLAEAVCILARTIVQISIKKYQSAKERHRSKWKQPKISASCVASKLAGLRMAAPLNTLPFTVAYLASKW